MEGNGGRELEQEQEQEQEWELEREREWDREWEREQEPEIAKYFQTNGRGRKLAERWKRYSEQGEWDTEG